MKNKYLLQVVLFFISFSGINAQNLFFLTHEGFKASYGKDYVVVETQLAAEANMNRLKMAINEILINDKDNTLSVQGTKLYVSSFTKDLFRISAGPMMQYMLDIDFTLTFSVKNNKVKINAPIIKNIGSHLMGIEHMVLCGTRKEHKELKKNQFIFIDGNPVVNNSKAKDALDSYFNDIINKIIEFLQEEEEW